MSFLTRFHLMLVAVLFAHNAYAERTVEVAFPEANRVIAREIIQDHLFIYVDCTMKVATWEPSVVEAMLNSSAASCRPINPTYFRVDDENTQKLISKALAQEYANWVRWTGKASYAHQVASVPAVVVSGTAFYILSLKTARSLIAGQMKKARTRAAATVITGGLLALSAWVLKGEWQSRGQLEQFASRYVSEDTTPQQWRDALAAKENFDVNWQLRSGFGDISTTFRDRFIYGFVRAYDRATKKVFALQDADTIAAQAL